jgi:GNAT superfamily N-acetyltransferase
MSQASDPDELFEVTGNELWPIIGDNAGLYPGILLHGRLDDNFKLSLSHRATQSPMEHRSGTAVQDRTQVKEGAGEEAVGCCALLRLEDGVFEVAKMAVAPSWQGRGLGRKVLEHVIRKAQELKNPKPDDCISRPIRH